MKILCNGCSFTYGGRLVEDRRITAAWPGQLAEIIDNSDVDNIAFSGSSNLEIFLRTLRQIQQQHYDLIIVQWSVFRRHWFEPNLDRVYICTGGVEENFQDWSGNTIYLSAAERKQFHNTLMMLTGDYRESIDVITFCNTLKSLMKPEQHVVFVNGLVPWGKDLIQLDDPTDMHKSMSKFTRDMLEFDFKDDQEIQKYYQELNNKLLPLQNDWINMTDPWRKNLIDPPTDNLHPGEKSHRWMAEKIKQYLIDKHIISCYNTV
jgi:lysophospholipase L1-like esterase